MKGFTRWWQHCEEVKGLIFLLGVDAEFDGGVSAFAGDGAVAAPAPAFSAGFGGKEAGEEESGGAEDYAYSGE